MHRQRTQVGSENPPPYELTPNQQFQYYGKSSPTPALNTPSNESSPLHTISNAPAMIAGPSCTPQQRMSNSPNVYHYINSRTSEHITSLLPPDHPEMICLQNGHLTETKFGLLGILAAVFWFPLGLGLCLLDQQVRCSRCGVTLEDGICRT